MILLKDNSWLREIIYIALATLAPAIPIYFLSDLSDFFKAPIALLFIILHTFAESEAITTTVELSVVLLSYSILFSLGMRFYGKRAVVLLAAFSVVNSVLAAIIISSIGGG